MASILSLGSNSGGQLATGDMDDVHYLKQSLFDGKIQNTENISKDIGWRVVGGGNHSFAWSTDGSRLFACGLNKAGEIALPVNETNQPTLTWTLVQLPTEGHVAQIACGWEHSILLNDLGQLFAAGSNSFGQLGTGTDTKRNAACVSDSSVKYWTPVLTSADSNDATTHLRFIAVACGLRHSLALTDKGHVYGWGANRHGQLGVASKDIKYANISQMVLVSEGLPPISAIACGRSHSFMLSADGRTVFAAGQNKFSQCGPSETQLAAGLWRSFSLPRRALKLCSGWEFGAVLLEPSVDCEGSISGGTVAMWGRGDHGQLATPLQNSPTKCSQALVYVPVDNIRDIACGSNHTIALSALSNAVYMWGWNEHGNAGDPSLEDVYQPLRVPNLNGSVQSIGCGYGNSYIVLN